MISFPIVTRANQSEFRLHVGNGSSYWAATVELYNTKSFLRYTGTSSSSTVYMTLLGVPINFVADLTDGDQNTANPSMEPVEPGNYLLRIYNNFCYLYIPTFNPAYNADFVIEYAGGVFSRLDNPNVGRQITISPTYTWTGYSVTVKNSFNVQGTMKIDNINFTIPATGKTFDFEQGSFPHTLSAIDQQPSGFTYNQRFYQWTGPNDFNSSDRTITINAGSGTYTANFKDEFNITFQNSFSDATGGVINVNGQHNAPYQTTALQDIGIDASAVTQTINGIRYDFDHWSDASTEGTNHHFSPTGHTTYTAYFIGTPLNVNRNLNFEASDPNQPITVNWNDHPDSNVTYKIWRKSKYQQQATSSPQLIGSVNSDTHSFIDYEFYGTNLGFTDWKLWYDVKAYFTLDGTSSADDYVQVFSNGMIAKRVDDLEDNITVSSNENKIDNYPNPFNPSTIISYQIVNAGHVTLKVYDNLGREIKTLVDREQNSGKYSVNFNADNLASGIYYYRITAGGFTAVKKMILTK